MPIPRQMVPGRALPGPGGACGSRWAASGKTCLCLSGGDQVGSLGDLPPTISSRFQLLVNGNYSYWK